MEVVEITGAIRHVQSSSQIITTNKPTSRFLQAGCPSCRPTNSVKALKGNEKGEFTEEKWKKHENRGIFCQSQYEFMQLAFWHIIPLYTKNNHANFPCFFIFAKNEHSVTHKAHARHIRHIQHGNAPITVYWRNFNPPNDSWRLFSVTGCRIRLR